MNIRKVGKFRKISAFKSTILLLVGALVFAATIKIYADTVATSVTVGNSAPAFTAGPAESVASTATTPTNVGSTITFQATATDGNNEGYYLAICKTNAITPGAAGAAPTCTGGSWCIDTVTASGVQASCTHTAVIGDAPVNNWYAFVCDDASSSSCSASSTGSGDTGSPFEVNHAPAFTAISSDSPKNPGDTITWSATASDPETGGTADTVKLIVCKTAGITGDDCDGGASDRWCSSSLVASNPTCGYSIPAVSADGSNNAYVYVVDNHNFGSASANQGAASDFTINNIAPDVVNVTLNGEAEISITVENQTQDVDVTATVTDVNSCIETELTTVTASLYRSGVGYVNCDEVGNQNNNNCYSVKSCTADVGSCTGASDSTATYTCTITIKHYADPTDVNTVYAAEHWNATVKATDDDAATDTLEYTGGEELASIAALDTNPTTTAYGSLSVGSKNDPLDKIVNVINTGNVGIDLDLSGTNLVSGGNNIAVAYQKYAMASLTAYASGTSLSGTDTTLALDISKTTTDTNQAKDTWWGLEIPSGTVAGVYSGTNSFTPNQSPSGNW